MIFVLHLALIPVAYWFAFLLRFDGAVPDRYVAVYWATLPLLLGLRLVAFAVFRQFRGWWRYVGMHDLAALVNALSWSTVLFVLALFLTGELRGYPRSIVLLDWLLALVLFGGIRFGVRWLREGRVAREVNGEAKRTLIVGAGDAAAQLIRQARLDPASGLRPMCLVDDNPSKLHIDLHGVPVLGTTRDLERLVVAHRIELIVVAIAAATREEMRRIAERCAGVKVEFKIVPSLLDLMDGKARLSQLRSVSVEDLLGRPSVRLDLKQVALDLHEKTVLITGAAGSIGAELARQVAAFGPARLLLLEQAESPLFFIEQEIAEAHPLHAAFEVAIVDDDGLDLGLGKRLVDDRGEFGVDNDELGGGMVEHEGDDRRIEPGIDGVKHGAGHGHGEMGLEHRRGVGEHHRHGVVLADAASGERRGKTARAGIELGIGVAPLAVDDGGMIGERRRCPLEEHERGQRLVIGLVLAEISIVGARHGPPSVRFLVAP